MATIEISIEEDILKEAEKVLNLIGMDVQIAVSVFLRRVAMEKGLPMSMRVTTSSSGENDVSGENQEPLSKETFSQTRSNTTITREMVDEVWQAFTKYYKGLGEISSLIDEVVENMGMNRGSASIYMYVLRSLVQGEPNTRIIKITDLEYLLKKIQAELGEDELRSAIQSLRQSIPYWREKIQGLYADKVEVLCKKYD